MKHRPVIALLLLASFPIFSWGQSAPTAEVVGNLPAQIEGTSTLFYLNGQFWTCNDHNTLVLYALDTLTTAITDSIVFDTTVYDLEEVTQDNEYLYFGDIGDNQGVRTDLHILRIRKSEIAAATAGVSADIACDTIWFSYPDRTPDSARNFDCEAFVATDTALLLFTKQWLSQGSTCYSIPKTPGRWEARRLFSLATQGLVTGACYQPERQLLVLCGYNILCAPFVYLVREFDGTDGGQHTHVDLTNGPGWQTEGIATTDGRHYFLTCEKLDAYGFNHPAQLLTLDLSDFLGENLSTFNPLDSRPAVYPNPAVNRIRLPESVKSVVVIDMQGRPLLSTGGNEWLDLGPLPPAPYLIRIILSNGQKHTLKFIKQ